MDVYTFLKENEFAKTTEIFKEELDTKLNMPYKSWALEPVKRLNVGLPILSHSERKIGYGSPEGSRKLSNYSNLMKNIFSKGLDIEISKPLSKFGVELDSRKNSISNFVEQNNWQNKSFGHSEDEPMIESKCVVDCPLDDSSLEYDLQNFSFCDTGSHGRSLLKESCMSGRNEDTTASNKNMMTIKNNAFREIEPLKLASTLLISKETPAFKALLSDGGRLISYHKICFKQE